MHATDVTQFSKPLEVVQYLLSVLMNIITPSEI